MGIDLAENNISNMMMKACFPLMMNCRYGLLFLLVSNLGINNYWDPEKVFEELHRVSRTGCQLGHSRKSMEEIIGLLKRAGFRNIKTFESGFKLRFLDGSSFLNHYFIKTWVSGGKEK